MQASEDSVALVKASGGWEHIDVALRSIVKQRGLLDVNEAKWLREALRVKLWREVGCVSMIDYMERRLGYAPRTASDRIRVAFTLEELPKIAAALGNGLPYSAARELTRVATAENEQTWLDAVRGKTVHEIEGMVSGRGRGANPDDPAHPSLVGRTLPFEGVRPATEALVRDARRMLQDERGGGAVITDDEVLASFARAVLEGGERERMKAPYQVAVTLCERWSRLAGQWWSQVRAVVCRHRSRVLRCRAYRLARCRRPRASHAGRDTGEAAARSPARQGPLPRSRLPLHALPRDPSHRGPHPRRLARAREYLIGLRQLPRGAPSRSDHDLRNVREPHCHTPSRGCVRCRADDRRECPRGHERGSPHHRAAERTTRSRNHASNGCGTGEGDRSPWSECPRGH